MLSFRYFIRLTDAFFSRFKGILFVGALLGILIFLFAQVLSPLFLKKTERIGIPGRYRSDNLPTFILEEVSSGLTKINENGIVEPALAENWESPDKGKTWIFHLRDNIFWQDGKPVTSKAIKYEFNDVEIETPDNKTIVFKLQDPFSPFPSVVSRPTFKKGLLGTGEWKVTKLTVTGGYVQKLVITDKKKNKKIYKFYPTEERAKLAYKLGYVDRLINIFDPKPFDTWQTAKVEKQINTGQVVSIFFNTKDPLLSEKGVRQALNYAIDKKAFEGKRAISPISPNSWVYNPQSKSYDYNPKRAKELLNDLPKQMRENLEIKLVTTPVLLPVAEKIANYWEKIGVRTVLQVTSVIPEDYQAFLAVFDIPKDPDQYSFWHSTYSTINISKYQNPRIDKLLEDGRVELNLEERRKIYLDFQRFLVEDSPAAFLFHPPSYTIIRK